MLNSFLRIIKPIRNGDGPVRVRRPFLRQWSEGVEGCLDLLSDGDDAIRTRKLFDQSQVANRVLKQMNEVSSLLTSALNIHLNVEQQFTMNTSNVFMSLQTLQIASLFGKEMPSVGKARLRLPSIWNLSLDEPQTGSLRVRSSFYLRIAVDFSFFLALVDFGTLAFVWIFTEYESISIDLVDLDGSSGECTSASHGSQSPTWHCHSSRPVVDHSFNVIDPFGNASVEHQSLLCIDLPILIAHRSWTLLEQRSLDGRSSLHQVTHADLLLFWSPFSRFDQRKSLHVLHR